MRCLFSYSEKLSTIAVGNMGNSRDIYGNDILNPIGSGKFPTFHGVLNNSINCTFAKKASLV